MFVNLPRPILRNVLLIDGVQVYFAFLSAVPALSGQTRASIHRNVMDILALHEELLGELHRVVPHSELNQRHSAWRWHTPERGSSRNHITTPPLESADGSLSKRKGRHSEGDPRQDRLHQVGVTVAAEVAGNVARVFTDLVRSPFISVINLTHPSSDEAVPRV